MIETVIVFNSQSQLLPTTRITWPSQCPVQKIEDGNAHHRPLGQVQLYIITTLANLLHRYSWKKLMVE